MDQVRSSDKMNPLRLGLGHKLGENTQGFRMGMAYGDGLSLLPGVANGQLPLSANRGSILNIIEERHVAEGAAGAGALRGVIGDRRGSGAAIDEEKIATAKQGH